MNSAHSGRILNEWLRRVPEDPIGWGLRGGNLTDCTPAALSMVRNSCANRRVAITDQVVLSKADRRLYPSDLCMQASPASASKKAPQARCMQCVPDRDLLNADAKTPALEGCSDYLYLLLC